MPTVVTATQGQTLPPASAIQGLLGLGTKRRKNRRASRRNNVIMRSRRGRKSRKGSRRN